MCGVVGVFNTVDLLSDAHKSELILARDKMFSRGPDFGGAFLNKSIGLGHRRLSIIDISADSNQPLSSNDGNLIIVFNGEIYNYLELKKTQFSKTEIFKTNGDTEVVLKLYQKYGRNVVNYLRGMFAFAIYDTEKSELFIARDHFGIKPLYYCFYNDVFYFSSQVKSLRKFQDIPDNVSSAGLVGYYLMGSVPEPHTIYENIKALPSGSTMIISREGVKEKYKYFDLRDNNIDVNDKNFSNIDLSYLFQDSVKFHLISDVPISSFLSSGIDSSIISAFAAQYSPLSTVTLGFDEFKGKHLDETVLARKTANHINSQHSEHYILKKEFNANFQHIIDAMDQPSIDGVNTYFVSKIASQLGFNVALSGLGADELLNGYGTTDWIKKYLSFQKYVPFARKINKQLLNLYGSSFLKEINPKYFGLLNNSGSIAEAYLFKRSYCLPHEIASFLDRDIFKSGWEELNIIETFNKSIMGVNNVYKMVHILETDNYMKNQLLKDSDWASMAHSLEIRVPFVDVELHKAIYPFLGKEILNKKPLFKLAQEILPDAISKRKKTGFGIPTSKWILEDSNITNFNDPRIYGKHVLDKYFL